MAPPLAMAFSIGSGLSPQAGIYCAIVTGFLISLLGGSKTQLGGPTGACVVVVVTEFADRTVAGEAGMILAACCSSAGWPRRFATGVYAIEEVARVLQATDRTLILCGAREQRPSCCRGRI